MQKWISLIAGFAAASFHRMSNAVYACCVFASSSQGTQSHLPLMMHSNEHASVFPFPWELGTVLHFPVLNYNLLQSLQGLEYEHPSGKAWWQVRLGKNPGQCSMIGHHELVPFLKLFLEPIPRPSNLFQMLRTSILVPASDKTHMQPHVALQPRILASVYTVYTSWVKSGGIKSVLSWRAYISSSKATWHSLAHTHVAPFFLKACNGTAHAKKGRKKWWYMPARPRKCCYPLRLEAVG